MNDPPADSLPRLREQMLRALLEQIAGGRYEDGQRLPPELQLARELGVSRGVVRELLRSLEDRGVVSIHHGRGAWVTAPSHWNVLDADVLAALMPTAASTLILTHYLECRRALETDAAELAARRASGRDLAAMADALARMTALAVESQSDANANRRFHEADIAFHGALFQATGNHVLPRIVEPMQRAMMTLRPHLALHPEHRLRRTLPEHRAILAAIADRNADRAREAMRQHLATVELYLQEYRMERSHAQRIEEPIPMPPSTSSTTPVT
jgi:GntR family transcriptional repressor for pyruvate dehydrogenase complex